ncbi:hypothetical protein, partial [Saccharolobus sp.]|uniref:hypothetical protein n=1 Tax=Saccharolobus sp. TaxID=2100761 RepID=UPI00319E98F6
SNQGTLQSIQNKLQAIGNLTPQVNGNSVQLGSATLVASAATMPLSQMRSTVEQATGLDQIKQQINSYYDNFPPLPQDLQQQVDKMHKIANTTVDLYTNTLVARAYSSITQLPNVSTDQQIQALQNAKQALENAKQDTQTLQSLGISIDPSQIQQSINNINQSINEIQTIQGSSQQLQNILKQIQNQLQTPQTAESLTSNLMNLSNQGLQIINNIIATYQKYGQSPDQSILSLQKKLQKIYDNARNEYQLLTGKQASHSLTQSVLDLATGNIVGAIENAAAGVGEGAATVGANIGANFVSLVGTAINDGLNDLSNFITNAIPGIAGQIIAGIVIGALFSLLQFIPGVNVAIDTAIGASIMAATMGAAIQQYYLSGISNPRTIAFDIAKSFATPEGIASLISGAVFSIGLPRLVDNVGDLFKSTNKVKVSGVVKSLDNAKVDLDNIRAKVGDSLKNLKLDKNKIDVAKVAKNLDIYNVLNREGVLDAIKANLDDITEQLNGIIRIDIRPEITPEGPNVRVAEAQHLNPIISLEARIAKLVQSVNLEKTDLGPEIAIKLPKSLNPEEAEILVKSGVNRVIADNNAIRAVSEGNLYRMTEVPKPSKESMIESLVRPPGAETLEINSGKVKVTTFSPDLLDLQRLGLDINSLQRLQGAIKELTGLPIDFTKLEAEFANGENIVRLSISKNFADYLLAKYDALVSQIRNIASEIVRAYQETPDRRAALEEIFKQGLPQKLADATKEIKLLNTRIGILASLKNLLDAVKDYTGIDIEPLLKDYIDGKLQYPSDLAQTIKEKVYDYYKAKIDSVENNILSTLQKKGATPEQIAEIKNRIDQLSQNYLADLDESISPGTIKALSAYVNDLGKTETILRLSNIDTEPLLKAFIEAKQEYPTELTPSDLVKVLNEKLYDQYKAKIDSVENNILSTLQKKGATPEQIAEIKNIIDQLASMRLAGFRNFSNPLDVADMIKLTNDYIDELHEIEKLVNKASNVNKVINKIEERLRITSNKQIGVQLNQINTKTENQPIGAPNQNIGQSNTPSATTSGGAKITSSGNQQLIQLQKADVGTITLRYSLSDIINTARQTLGEDFDRELYAFSKLFGQDSLEQAILDAAKKSPTPDLDSIARTLGDVIKSKVDEALKNSPDKVVSTIESMLKINNDLVKSKLTTDLLDFIKNNPKVTFRDLLTFTEKDLPKIVNDVKDTLITEVLDQLSKGFGDLTNIIGKDSLKTFLENELKNGVFDVNKLLDDAKAFADSKLAELLKANPEKILSTILDEAKIGNKLVRDKLLADTLDFVKRFGGNVTLKDIAEFIAKDAADLKIQLARALNSGNLEELAKTFPALKNVIEELKKDPLRGLRQYFSLIDPTLANALNKITPDNALDILNALKNNDLAKISQITGLSVDQLKSPQVKLSIISEIFDDLMEKLKAKQITDKEFESAVESLKVMLDETLKDYKNLLGDYGDNLQEQLQEVENNVKRKRIPKVVELYKTVIPSVAALPVVLSIESASDVSYLLNYAEQLPSEEQAPLVSEQMPQQQVQVQEGATVLPTPVEPETPTLAEPLAPPPTAPNGEEQPTYQPQMGPNAPALISGRNTKSVSGQTQEQVLYFPIS